MKSIKILSHMDAGFGELKAGSVLTGEKAQQLVAACGEKGLHQLKKDKVVHFGAEEEQSVEAPPASDPTPPPADPVVDAKAAKAAAKAAEQAAKKAGK